MQNRVIVNLREAGAVVGLDHLREEAGQLVVSPKAVLVRRVEGRDDAPAGPPLTLREPVVVTQPAAHPIEFHCYRTDTNLPQAVHDISPAQQCGLQDHFPPVPGQVHV